MATHLQSRALSLRQTSLFTPSNFPSKFESLSRTRSFNSTTVQCRASKQLPPLVASLAIPGLPPCQESVFTDAALNSLPRDHDYWLHPHHHVCTSFASFMHSSVTSCDRLKLMSTAYALLTFLDDTLFDSPNASRDVHTISAYLRTWNALLREEERPPLQMTPVQELTWALGRDLRAQSTPEWFTLCADAMLDFNLSSLELHSANLVGERKHVRDVDSFTKMRIRDSGSVICTLGVEFCNNQFLSPQARHLVRDLTRCSWIYFGYVNDIFSYSKEKYEAEPWNLIRVLTESEGLPLHEAAWRAVRMANSVACDYLEGEKELGDEPWALPYVEGLKGLMSGVLYWHSLQRRYRHPEAAFPELRDVESASFSPRARDFQGHHYVMMANPGHN